jgi:hypothetical protein
MKTRFLLVSVLALALIGIAATASAAPSGRALPTAGVLAPGISLGGLQIGYTKDQVIKHWGHSYRICPKNVCKGTDTVWYYVYAGSEPLGAAVRFDQIGKVNAIFTLGSPAGWRTAQGLLIGQGVSDAQRLYGSNLRWSVCIGYGAMSMRTGKAVTSIYTSGESIYGFAITSPGTPVCQ